MIIPEDSTHINETVFHVSVDSPHRYDGYLPENLNFTWEIIDFQQRKMFI